MFKLHKLKIQGFTRKPIVSDWAAQAFMEQTVTKRLVSIDSIYYMLFSNVQTNCIGSF